MADTEDTGGREGQGKGEVRAGRALQPELTDNEFADIDYSGNNTLDSQGQGEHNKSGTRLPYTVQAMSQFFPSQFRGGRRVVIILKTSLDESEPDAHGSAQATVVAGWVSDVSRWEAFTSRWQQALDEWGLDYFHMTDFESPYASPYKDWSPEQHRDRLNHLLTLIRDHVVAGVSASIPREVYELAIPDKLKKRVNPYHIAALACLIRVAGVLRHETPEDVMTAIVYEERGKGSGPVLDAYRGIRNDPKLRSELRVVSLSFQPKLKDSPGGVAFLPLQAADILAFETMKDVVNRRATNPRKRRYPMCQLEATTDIRTSEYGVDQLRLLAPLLEQIFPESLPYCHDAGLPCRYCLSRHYSAWDVVTEWTPPGRGAGPELTEDDIVKAIAILKASGPK